MKQTKFLPTLQVVCTANRLVYPELTSVLNIANGTRGIVIANLCTPHTQVLTVVMIDFPSYTGPSLIGPGWPLTWIPVAPVTRLCETGYCERTGFPSHGGAYYVIQKPTPHMWRWTNGCYCIAICEDLLAGEKRCPRAFYVALKRTIHATVDRRH